MFLLSFTLENELWKCEAVVYRQQLFIFDSTVVNRDKRDRCHGNHSGWLIMEKILHTCTHLSIITLPSHISLMSGSSVPPLFPLTVVGSSSIWRGTTCCTARSPSGGGWNAFDETVWWIHTVLYQHKLGLISINPLVYPVKLILCSLKYFWEFQTTIHILFIIRNKNDLDRIRPKTCT